MSDEPGFVLLEVAVDTALTPHDLAEYLRRLLLGKVDTFGCVLGIDVVLHSGGCGECEASPVEHTGNVVRTPTGWQWTG